MTAGRCRSWCPPRGCRLHFRPRSDLPRVDTSRMTIRGGEVRVYIKGMPVHMLTEIDCSRLHYLETTPPPTINLPTNFTITMKIEGDGFRDLLCPASVTRTQAGAWLVKGRGPTRRYSTKGLACRVARARDRKYAVEHRIRGRR